MKLKVPNKKALSVLEEIIVEGYKTRDKIEPTTDLKEAQKLFSSWMDNSKASLEEIYSDTFAVFQFWKHEELNLVGQRWSHNREVGNVIDNIYIKIDVLSKLRDQIIYTEREWYEKWWGITSIAVGSNIIIEIIKILLSFSCIQ